LGFLAKNLGEMLFKDARKYFELSARGCPTLIAALPFVAGRQGVLSHRDRNVAGTVVGRSFAHFASSSNFCGGSASRTGQRGCSILTLAQQNKTLARNHH
jgi:hypothetical protein